MIELRPYQTEAIEAVRRAAAEGVRRTILQLPTGMGKTVVAAALAATLDVRTLFLVHRDELVLQTAAKIRLCYPGATIGVVKGPEDDPRRKVVIASIQTVSRAARLERLVASGAFGLVIPDEAHHSAAPTWKRVLDAVVGPETILVGLTATPNRADGLALQGVFDRIVYRKTIIDGIRGGFLVDVEKFKIKTRARLDDVATRAGDFAEGALAHAMMAPDVLAATFNGWIQRAEKLRTLAFAVDVEHAKTLAAGFERAGYRAAHVDGEMDLDERRRRLAAFRRREIQILTNCAVLTEGFDDPAIECVLVCRPTLSESLYIQMVGRGLRPAPEKTKLVLLDATGDSNRHSLVQLGTLAGRAPDAETIEKATGKKKLDPKTLDPDHVESLFAFATGVADVEKVDAFKAAWQRRRFEWVSTRFGYALELGAPDLGFLLLRPAKGDDSGLFRIVRVYLDGWRGRFELLTEEPIAVDWATGLAEGAAARFLEDKGRGARGAKWQERAADWRTKEPTDGQIRELSRLGLPVPATRGEASLALARPHCERDVAGFATTTEGRGSRAHLRTMLERGELADGDLERYGLTRAELEVLNDGDARRLRSRIYSERKGKNHAAA